MILLCLIQMSPEYRIGFNVPSVNTFCIRHGNDVLQLLCFCQTSPAYHALVELASSFVGNYLARWLVELFNVPVLMRICSCYVLDDDLVSLCSIGDAFDLLGSTDDTTSSVDHGAADWDPSLSCLSPTGDFLRGIVLKLWLLWSRIFCKTRQTSSWLQKLRCPAVNCNPLRLVRWDEDGWVCDSRSWDCI